MTVTSPAQTRVVAAQRATYAAFIGSGVVFASWASRIPQVRDHLHLSPAQLGLVLLSIAAGSIVATPLAGVIVHRFTSGRTVAGMSALTCAMLGVVAVGFLIGVVPVVAGLSIFGFGYGAWDVAMNVQGATVERHLGRSIMPRFHAGYSVGTVIGALIGAVMVAVHVPVTAHLLVIAVVVAVVVPLEVRRFLPDTDDGEPVAHGGALSRWREPRTLMIGLFVLTFAFTEGTGNDWISVALIDGHGTPAVIGTLGFATFLAAMTIARWFGTALLDRFGRVSVVRALAVLAAVGLVLFVFGGWTPVAFVGALLWGFGASLGFPVGMSAAADDPAAAPTRVSAVGSIAYCAFLGGPPVVGFLGDRFDVLHAMLSVAGLLAVSLLLAGALRPLERR